MINKLKQRYGWLLLFGVVGGIIYRLVHNKKEIFGIDFDSPVTIFFFTTFILGLIFMIITII